LGARSRVVGLEPVPAFPVTVTGHDVPGVWVVVGLGFVRSEETLGFGGRDELEPAVRKAHANERGERVDHTARYAEGRRICVSVGDCRKECVTGNGRGPVPDA
jgi:hypothetical protein